MRKEAASSVVAFGLAFLAMVLFMEFDADDFSLFDTFASSLARPYQTLIPVEFFVAITTIGSVTGIIALAALTLFLLRRERVTVARILIALVGTSASVGLVKIVVERARPDALPWIGALHSYSFPSGHAGSAMALFGSVGVILFLRARSIFGKIASILLAAGLILAIGISRIVLSAHYFSDVFAGYLLGAFWVSLAFSLSASALKMSKIVR